MPDLDYHRELAKEAIKNAEAVKRENPDADDDLGILTMAVQEVAKEAEDCNAEYLLAVTRKMFSQSYENLSNLSLES